MGLIEELEQERAQFGKGGTDYDLGAYEELGVAIRHVEALRDVIIRRRDYYSSLSTGGLGKRVVFDEVLKLIGGEEYEGYDK